MIYIIVQEWEQKKFVDMLNDFAGQVVSVTRSGCSRIIKIKQEHKKEFDQWLT